MVDKTVINAHLNLLNKFNGNVTVEIELQLRTENVFNTQTCVEDTLLYLLKWYLLITVCMWEFWVITGKHTSGTSSQPYV